MPRDPAVGLNTDGTIEVYLRYTTNLDLWQMYQARAWRDRRLARGAAERARPQITVDDPDNWSTFREGHCPSTLARSRAPSHCDMQLIDCADPPSPCLPASVSFVCLARAPLTRVRAWSVPGVLERPACLPDQYAALPMLRAALLRV